METDYDLIVVGAGAGGAVVAARVSEDPHVRVLVIESGPDYPNLEALPEDLRDGNRGSLTAHDWRLRYIPSTTSRPGQAFPRGRVTGGSSAVNTAIALRGQPSDYDEWASLGNPEWSWEKVLPLSACSKPTSTSTVPITARPARSRFAATRATNSSRTRRPTSTPAAGSAIRTPSTTTTRRAPATRPTR